MRYLIALLLLGAFLAAVGCSGKASNNSGGTAGNFIRNDTQKGHGGIAPPPPPPPPR